MLLSLGSQTGSHLPGSYVCFHKECLALTIEVPSGPARMGRVWLWGQPEAETAVRQLLAHISVGQKTEKGMWLLPFSFFSYSIWNPSPWRGSLHTQEGVFPLKLIISGNALTDTPMSEPH